MTLTRILMIMSLYFVGLIGQASAHAHLRSAAPTPEEAVASSPRELDLSFSEGLNLAFTGVELVGPDGKVVKTGGARLAKDSDAKLVVPIAAALGTGTYTVRWHALATDGHKTNGSYTFKVGP